MNKDRRKRLTELTERLEEIRDDLRTVKDALETELEDEREYHDNMPDGIRDSEKGEQVEAGIDALDEANDMLDRFLEDDPIEKITEAL